MSERGLEFEQNLVGWLAHSPSGRSNFATWYVPDVLLNKGVDKYIEMLLQHGPGSAGARLKDMQHTGSIDTEDVETAVRWSKGAPAVDDDYMLETAKVYYRYRCHAVHSEQVILATEVWDEKLIEAADAELRKRMAKLSDKKKHQNGFTAAGVAKAFSKEKREDLFTFSGYVGRFFRGRSARGDFIAFQAQPKTGKSAAIARCGVAGVRNGRRVLHISVGDQDQYESAARIISSEFQRNGEPYGEDGYRGIPCCAKCKSGCDKKCFEENGYAPLNPPVAAQYLEETEVPAILDAFPSFKPCTLCKGTRDYVPGIWWERADDAPIDEEEAVDLYEEMVACGEYGQIETLYYPARQLTATDLANLLEERKQQGRPVDILEVDYADMMGIESGVPKWEGLQYMWESMRALAPEDTGYNCLVITGTQGNRSGGDMKTQNTTTSAGTRASVDNATLVLSLNQTAAERAHHLLRVAVVAARKGSFAPEHQAMCISRMDIQDPFFDSWHVWVKADKRVVA